MKIYKKTQDLLHNLPETEVTSFTDLTQNYVDIAKATSANVKEKNGQLSLTVVYHKYDDEKYAAREAEIEAATKLKDCKIPTRFEHINEDTIKGFVSDSKVKAETQNSDKTETKDWFNILGLIITLLGPSGLVGVFSSAEIRNIKSLFWPLISLFALIFVIGVIYLLVRYTKKKRDKARLLNEMRQSLDVSTVKEWNAGDFTYKSQNVVFVFFYTTEESIYWKIFSKYLEYLPSKTVFSCIIFKRSGNLSNKINFQQVSDIFCGKAGYIGERDKFKKINKNKQNTVVLGFLLIPLKEEEIRSLIEELNLPRSFVNRSRDTIYKFYEKGEQYLSTNEYLDFVNNIYNTICKNTPITLENIKRLISFLAVLKKITSFIPRNLNIIHDSVETYFLSQELINEMRSALLNDECSEESIKNTIRLIWSGWQYELIDVADREYALLSDIDTASQELPLSPFKWAIESFLNYLDNCSNKADRNDYYYRAASEIQIIIDKLIIWHKNNNQSVLATYFSEKFTDIFKTLIRLNSANCLYYNNYELLRFIQEKIFVDTRDTGLAKNVDAFYVSQEIKIAFMQNAVVVPNVIDDEFVEYSGNISNKCREMHKLYLMQRSQILGVEYAVETNVPSYFELFGACQNNAEYYSLILLNQEHCILDFYKQIYQFCNDIATNHLRYFRYFTTADEIDPVEKEDGSSVLKIAEKLYHCLAVEGQSSYLNIMLKGELSCEELLTCGLLNCDVFFLMHDLYLLQQKNNQQFIFSEFIGSKTYKIIDNFICIEEVNRFDVNHRFSNMFSDMTQMIAKSGAISFFVKYFLSIINVHGISDSNTEIIKLVVLSYPHLQLKQSDGINLNNDEIRELLEFCLGVKVRFGFDFFAKTCQFVKMLTPKGKFAEEMQMLIKCVLNEENVVLRTPTTQKKFVEKMKTFSDVSCYLIYAQMSEKEVGLYKYSHIIANKIINARYIANLIPLICSIDYLESENKVKVMRSIVDNIKYNIYDRNILGAYFNFFYENKEPVDEYKYEGYSDIQLQTIDMLIKKIVAKEGKDLYYHLDKDAGFIFLYAQNLIEKMCLLRVRPIFNNGEFGLHEIYAKINEMRLTFEENGKKYIAQEFLMLIQGLASGQIYDISNAAKIKIINELITLLEDKNSYISLEKQAIDLHKSLLVNVLNRI